MTTIPVAKAPPKGPGGLTKFTGANKAQASVFVPLVGGSHTLPAHMRVASKTKPVGAPVAKAAPTTNK